jgi:hypothetical protein
VSGYVPLPAPVTADPNFWKQGVENLNALRDQQAKQASADAYRQSTDPATGQVDVPKYNALIARGPGAWNAGALMQQQGQAAGAQATAGTAQVAKASAIYNMAGTAAASLMNDPSDANIDNVEAGLRTSGAPPEVLAELDRIKSIQDPAQRRAVAYQHTLSMMDAQHRMAAGGFPTPTVTQFGGTSAPVTITPATPYGPGGMAVGGGVAHTVDPATYNAPQQSPMMLDANGQPTNDPTKAVRSVPRDVPRGPAFGMPPPGSVGGPPGSGPGGPPPPSGGLPPGAPPLPAGMVLRGGVFQPRTAAPASNAATPPPAAVLAAPPLVSTSPTLRGPGSPATPPAPAPAARSPIAGVVTGLPTGAEKATETDIGAYKADQAAQPDVQTRAQNMAHAYDALQQLKSATGRGAEGINNLRSWAQTLGIAPPGAVDEQKLFEIVHKYTERAMIDAAGGGSTDMGKRMQEQANAGTLLSTPANLEIMRNDMGKTLQTAAAYKDHDPNSGGAGYLANRAKVADTTDPRGFVWNLYSPEEQAKINAEVDKNPDAAAKLHKAIGMANRLKLQIPGLMPPSPAPQKQSFLAPSGPAPNPLMMSG